MTIAEFLARKRATGTTSRNAGREAITNDTVAQRSAIIRLALFAVLSVAVYYITLVGPYGLQRLWMWHQLDLDRMHPIDPNARWFIAGGLIAAGLLYFLAFRTVRELHDQRLAWAVVIGGALVSGITLLFFYPLGSTDIWDYIIHGRMLGIYNANPFVRVAAQYPQDVFSWYAGWPYDTSAYGPFWEVLAAATARLVGNGIVANVVAFKALSGLFLAASVATVAIILRQQAPEKALAGAMLLAWNPVVLYETLANGHNDIVMVFWILVAVYMILSRHYTFAILALVAGALVKFMPLLLIPAAGLIALRELPNLRRRALFVVGTAVAAIALIVVAYQPFWEGVQILGIERRQEMFTSTLPAAIVAFRTPLVGWLEATAQVSKIAGMLTALYAVFEGFRAMRDRSWTSFTRSAFNIFMFYLLFTNLWFWPWYAIWVLALAPLLPSGYATRLAQVFGAAAMTKPLIFGPLYGWNQPPEHDWLWQQMRLGPSVMALPWVYALYGLWMTFFQYVQGRFAAARAEPAPAGTPAFVAVPSREPSAYRLRQDADD